MTYKEATSLIYQMPWKTPPCVSGEECWCRLIVPEHSLEYTNSNGEVELYDYIVHSGSLDKELAEYIVELHNKNIE